MACPCCPWHFVTGSHWNHLEEFDNFHRFWHKFPASWFLSLMEESFYIYKSYSFYKILQEELEPTLPISFGFQRKSFHSVLKIWAIFIHLKSTIPGKIFFLIFSWLFYGNTVDIVVPKWSFVVIKAMRCFKRDEFGRVILTHSGNSSNSVNQEL